MDSPRGRLYSDHRTAQGQGDSPRPYTQPCAGKGPRCRGWPSSRRGAAEVGGHRGAEGAAGLLLRAGPKHTAGTDRSSRLLTAPQPALPYQQRPGSARLYSAPQDRPGPPLTASRRRGTQREEWPPCCVRQKPQLRSLPPSPHRCSAQPHGTPRGSEPFPDGPSRKALAPRGAVPAVLGGRPGVRPHPRWRTEMPDQKRKRPSARQAPRRKIARSPAVAGRGGAARGAKMAAVLQQVLERAELAKLPKAVQGKLERFLADQQSEIDGLRARHERFKVDSGKRGARGSRGWTGSVAAP